MLSKFPHFLIIFLILAIGGIGFSRAEMRIRPHGLGADGSLYVLSAGSRLELECQVERGDFSGSDDVNALDWTRGKLRIAHNWLSMYTQPKVDDQGRWIRQTLVIPSVDQQSAGEYKCLFYDDQQRTVRLHVLESLNWRTASEKPGGPVGQPLTIDCGADGLADEAIKILDHKGRAIDESTSGEVVVGGSEVTITRLGRQHQGMKIRCVAIRQINLQQLGTVGSDSLHTDERELVVDVWLPPKFDETEAAIPHYAVPGSKQVLRWTVVESNPPVKQWTLHKDGHPIGGTGARPNASPERIEIVQRMEEQQPMFAVSIDEVKDEDFGRYTLHVHNGKLDSEQTMSLVVTKPPGQPRVQVEWVSSNGSVNWRVEEQRQQGQLPVSYFWIIYKPIRRVQLPSAHVDQNGITGRTGQQPKGNAIVQSSSSPLPPLPVNPNGTQPYRLRRRKNPTNLYDIAGLDSHTEYEFTFVAGNQAGESDPLTLKVATVDRPPNEQRGTSSSSSASTGRSVVTALMLALLPMVLFVPLVRHVHIL